MVLIVAPLLPLYKYILVGKALTSTPGRLCVGSGSVWGCHFTLLVKKRVLLFITVAPFFLEIVGEALHQHQLASVSRFGRVCVGLAPGDTASPYFLNAVTCISSIRFHQKWTADDFLVSRDTIRVFACPSGPTRRTCTANSQPDNMQGRRISSYTVDSCLVRGSLLRSRSSPRS